VWDGIPVGADVADALDPLEKFARRSGDQPGSARSVLQLIDAVDRRSWGRAEANQEAAMSLPDRVKTSFLALLVSAIACTISLSAPSLGQAHAETGGESGQQRATTVHHHLHMRAAYIVCDTPDVHSCHKEFARRLRERGH
jgi:hypothetical protein